MIGGSHGLTVLIRASRDVACFVLAFTLANLQRFGTLEVLHEYVVSVSVGAFMLAVVAYVLGLYSEDLRLHSRPAQHVFLVLASMGAGLLAATVIGYLDFSARLGRGLMGYGLLFLTPLLLGHHLYLFHRHRFSRERLLLVHDGAEDRAVIDGVMAVLTKSFVGVEVLDLNGREDGAERVANAASVIKECRVVFTEAVAHRGDCLQVFRRLRYSGTAVVPLVQLAEEVLQYVPLHLLNEDWFLRADASSRLFYFRKLKRSFDVLTALLMLVLLSPMLLVGALMVMVGSPEGPVFFRQRRVGRFGRVFEIWKLRTMRVDAERDGPQWSSGKSDRRVFPGASFLRRYRIDEIPQLLNVLRGEMSFVGPRPEQPSIVEELARELPSYEERHMIHPGLTGWAQVRYPYGASLEDAKCKLEYDLYYLKHAGVLFDALILLDTVGVVLRGGLSAKSVKPRPLAT